MPRIFCPFVVTAFALTWPCVLAQRSTLFGCPSTDTYAFTILGNVATAIKNVGMGSMHGLALDFDNPTRPKRLLYADYASATGNFIKALGETGTMWNLAGSATTSYSGSGVSALTAGITSNQIHIGVDNSTGDFYFGDGSGTRVRRVKYSGNIDDFLTAALVTTATLTSNGYGGGVDSTARTFIHAGSTKLFECKIDIATITGANLACNSPSITPSSFSSALGTTVSYWGGTRTVWVPDSGGNRVYSYTLSGTAPTSTWAAGVVWGTGTATATAGSTSDSVAATGTTFKSPYDVAIDQTNGDVYISDSGNNKIRMVSGGQIYTVAGSGSAGSTSSADNVVATSTTMTPRKIAVDGARKLLIFSDNVSKRIRGLTCRRTNAAGFFYNLTANTNDLCPAGFYCPANNNYMYAFGGWIGPTGTQPIACTVACPAGSSSDTTGAAPETSSATASPSVQASSTTSASVSPVASPSVSASMSTFPSPSTTSSISPAVSPSVSATTTPAPDDFSKLFDEETGVLGLIKGTDQFASNGKLLACGGASGNNADSSLLFTIYGNTPKAIVQGPASPYTVGGLALDFAAGASPSRSGRLLFWQGSVEGAVSPYSSLRTLEAADGAVSYLAGGAAAVPGFAGDGQSAISPSVQLGTKIGEITVDSSTGDVYFTETDNGRVRKVAFSSGLIDTVAGNGQLGNSDGPATTTAITSPLGLFFDASLRGGFTSQRLYISSSGGNYGNNIRQLDFGVSPPGLAVIAGNNISVAAENSGYVNADGNFARFNQPGALSLHEDPATGSKFILIADTANNAIRAILPDGSVHTVVGKGDTVVPAIFSPDGSFVNASTIVNPQDVVTDALTGDLYFIEGGAGVIRMVDRDGALRTVVGQPSVFSSPSAFQENVAPTASAAMPRRMVLDSARRLLVFSDVGIPAIRAATCKRTNPGGYYFDLASNSLQQCPEGKFCPQNNGIIAAFGGFAGDEVPSPCPDGLICPMGSAAGILPSSSVTPSATPSTTPSASTSPSISGTTTASSSVTPSGTPAPPTTLFNCPVDQNVIFTIYGPSASSLVKPAGSVNTPYGITLDVDSDTRPRRMIFHETSTLSSNRYSFLRSIDMNGALVTLGGQNGSTSWNNGGTGVLVSNANVYFSNNNQIALDPSTGDLYLADGGNARLRRVKYSTSFIDTIAGTGTQTPAGNTLTEGVAATAQVLGTPGGVLLDGKILFIASSGTHVIRRITDVSVAISSMELKTVAGQSPTIASGSANGPYLAGASFNGPNGISMQKWPNGTRSIYVADTNNHLVRVLRPDGQVATVAGVAGSNGYNGDTLAALSTLKNPQDVAWDEVSQQLFIADMNNGVVRMVDSYGRIYSVAGIPSNISSASNYQDNVPATESALKPNRIFVDGARKLMIIADNGVRAVRAVTCLRTNPAGLMYDLILNALVDCPAGYYCPEGNGAIRAFGAFVVAPPACPSDMYCPDGAFEPLVPSVTSTTTPSPSVTSTETPSTSVAPSVSVSSTVSSSVTGSPSITASVTPSSSVTPSVTASTTISPSISASGTPSSSVAASVTVSPSVSPSRTADATRTPSVSPSGPWQPAFLGCPDNENMVFTVYGTSSQALFFQNYTIGTSLATGGIALDFNSPSRPKRLLFAEGSSGTWSYIRALEDGVGAYVAVGGTSGTGSAGAAVAENIAANRTDVKLAGTLGQIAIDPTNGDLYITETSTHRLRKYDYVTRNITTVAGTGATATTTASSGVATSTLLQAPQGVFVDTVTTPGKTRIYITSGSNSHTIRLFDPSTNTLSLLSGPTSSTFAYGAGPSFSSATWYTPKSLAMMTNGTDRLIFVSDSGNQVIRVLKPFSAGALNGTVSLFAGVPNTAGSTDNALATVGRINLPSDIVIDEFTNDVYIADNGNNLIRMVSPIDGKIRAVVGVAGSAPSTASPGAENVRGTSTLAKPNRMALDAARKLLVFVDEGNKYVRGVTCKRKNPSGYYWDVLENRLEQCAAGMLCADGNNFMTMLGRWVGQIVPPVCVGGAGRYCPAGAGGEASLCPGGFYCPAPYREPVVCPAGFMCPGGVESPIPCTYDYQCPEGSAFANNASATSSVTASVTASSSVMPSESPSTSETPSQSVEPTVSPTTTATSSPGPIGSPTSSASLSAFPTGTPSVSGSTSASPSVSRSESATRSVSASVTASGTETPSSLPTSSTTPSTSPSSSISPTGSASATVTPTASPPVRNDAGLPVPVVWLTFDSKLVPDKYSSAPDASTSGGFTALSSNSSDTGAANETIVVFGSDRGGNPGAALVLGAAEGAADVLVSNGIPAGTPFGASPRTVALWVKLSAFEAGGSGGSVLFSYGASTPEGAGNGSDSTEWRLHIQMLERTIEEEVTVTDEAGNVNTTIITRVALVPVLMIGDLQADPGLQLPLNRWFHVAATYSGDGSANATTSSRRRLQASGSDFMAQPPPYRRSLFFNGVLVAQDESNRYLFTEPSPITIGPMKGSIDEISILTKPLVKEEVQSVYTASPGEFSRPIETPPTPSPVPPSPTPAPRRLGATLSLPIQLAGASFNGLVAARSDVLTALRADLSRALQHLRVAPDDIDINWCSSRIVDLFPVLHAENNGGGGFTLGIGCSQPQIPGCSVSGNASYSASVSAAGGSGMPGRRALSSTSKKGNLNDMLARARRRLQSEYYNHNNSSYNHDGSYNGTTMPENVDGGSSFFNGTGSGSNYNNNSSSNNGDWGSGNQPPQTPPVTDWISFYYGGESYQGVMNEQPWVMLQVSILFPKGSYNNDVFAARDGAKKALGHLPSLFADHQSSRDYFSRTIEVASRASRGRTVTVLLDASSSAEQGVWIGIGQQSFDVDGLLALAFSTEQRDESMMGSSQSGVGFNNNNILPVDVPAK